MIENWDIAFLASGRMVSIFVSNRFLRILGFDGVAKARCANPYFHFLPNYGKVRSVSINGTGSIKSSALCDQKLVTDLSLWDVGNVN